MKNTHRFITALAVSGALVGLSAAPAGAVINPSPLVNQNQKQLDSARVLDVATVGIQAIKDKNWDKFCQMVAPRMRSQVPPGTNCGKFYSGMFTSGQFIPGWATDSLAYFKGPKAKPVIGRFEKYGSGHDAKIEFNLNVRYPANSQGNVWAQLWGFRVLKGKSACYHKDARCWRISLISSIPQGV